MRCSIKTSLANVVVLAVLLLLSLPGQQAAPFHVPQLNKQQNRGQRNERLSQLEVIQQLRQKVAAEPDKGHFHLELGTALQKLTGQKNGTELEHHLRRAMELLPRKQHLKPLNLLAGYFIDESIVDKALNATAASITLCQELNETATWWYASAHLRRAKALAIKGDVSEAFHMYTRAGNVSFGVSCPVWTAAMQGLRNHTDEQYAQLEQAVRTSQRLKTNKAKLNDGWDFMSSCVGKDRSWNHFALFSANADRNLLAQPIDGQASAGWSAHVSQGSLGRVHCLHCRDYDRAWANLELANQLQQDERQPFFINQTDLQELLDLFPDSDLKDPSSFISSLLRDPPGHRDSGQILVFGMPRSGSTLTEQILHAHPDVFGAGEVDTLQPRINAMIEILGEPNQDQEIARLGRAYADDMRRWLPAAEANTTYIVNKMLGNVWNLWLIAVMLPDACLVHTVRHPLDTALSCFQQAFGHPGMSWALDVRAIAERIRDTDLIMEQWERMLPGRVFQMSYERNVHDHRAANQAMLAHCGLPWTEEVLDFSKAERVVKTASLFQVRQQLYDKSVGRWRDYARHFEPVMDILQATIDKYEARWGRYLPHVIEREAAKLGKQDDFRSAEEL